MNFTDKQRQEIKMFHPLFEALNPRKKSTSLYDRAINNTRKLLDIADENAKRHNENLKTNSKTLLEEVLPGWGKKHSDDEIDEEFI